MAGAAALFVAGFTVVFGAILVGVVWLADALVDNQAVLQRVGGVVMIAMGLAFVGLIPVLPARAAAALAAPGGGCGARRSSARCSGWAGCRASGPTLAGVVAVAAGTGGGSLRGVVLTLAYCAGLGVPFVLIAIFATRAVRALGWLRRHTRAIQIGGGALLIGVGLLLLTGLWDGWLAELQTSVGAFVPVI